MERNIEIQHFYAVVRSFECYQEFQKRRFDQKYRDWRALPKKYKDLIPNMEHKFKYIDFCIEENQLFLLKCIAPHILTKIMGSESKEHNRPECPKKTDLDKVKSTLQQCLRDWAIEGEIERQMCYGPILDTLKNYYPDLNQRKSVKILNPGCGLGRLTWEIARMGFLSQGNEFSYHMILASNIILNHTKEKEEFEIFPYITTVKNVWRFRDQCGKYAIPDVYPRILKNNGDNFTMVAGNFLDVYKKIGEWDVVVTCFFIDTAKNIMEYLTHLKKIIPEGGYWINIGPLLYHYEELNEVGVELTYEELRAIIPSFGFKFIEEKQGLSTTYSQNELSMFQMIYNTAFFVCKRVTS